MGSTSKKFPECVLINTQQRKATVQSRLNLNAWSCKHVLKNSRRRSLCVNTVGANTSAATEPAGSPGPSEANKADILLM